MASSGSPYEHASLCVCVVAVEGAFAGIVTRPGSMSERIRVVVKPTAGGDKLEKLVELASTIEELKQALAADCGIPADAQRLIYRGQILRDERTVSSYGALTGRAPVFPRCGCGC